MKIFITPKEFIEFRNQLTEEKIAFIPTMGALHDGHLSLIRKAKAENDLVVVSIFLNQTQFDNQKDYENYPISVDEDIEKLAREKVDCFFHPTYKEIYPENYRYRVKETENSLELCGKDRPGHFDGVLTVVLKLFNIIRPHRAYFGEKDMQQLQLIQGMVRSFFLDIEIVPCATARDDKGLALSSRNKKLSSEDLELAQFFAKNLQETGNLEDLRQQLQSKGIEVDYLVEKDQRRFAAVKISGVRLIDNVKI